jgi:hypothetical protein
MHGWKEKDFPGLIPLIQTAVVVDGNQSKRKNLETVYC